MVIGYDRSTPSPRVAISMRSTLVCRVRNDIKVLERLGIASPLREAGVEARVQRSIRQELLPGRCFERLYSSRDDGWGGAICHRLCDGKGPTLMVVQSAKRSTILCYTRVLWKSPDVPTTFDDDPTAFFAIFLQSVADRKKSDQHKPAKSYVSRVGEKGGGERGIIVVDDGQMMDEFEGRESVVVTHMSGEFPVFGTNNLVIDSAGPDEETHIFRFGGSFKAPDDAPSFTAKFAIRSIDVFRVI